MMKMTIPITKGSDDLGFATLIAMPKITGTFALSILLAMVLGIFTGALLHAQKIDPATQIAGVANVSPTENTNIVPVLVSSETSLPSTEANNSPLDNEATLKAQAVASQKEEKAHNDTLVVFINTHETEITQVNRELEDIKDTSVALIAEFNQNCGNWKDDCAKPFSTILETNNARYSVLTIRLSELTQELAVAESERTDFALQ